MRNVSLEDHTFRTEGGAFSLGASIGSAGRASLDYWPTTSQQRTVTVFTSEGERDRT